MREDQTVYIWKQIKRFEDIYKHNKNIEDLLLNIHLFKITKT